MLIVHHLNNSRSQRVLWLLEELGVPYEVKNYQRNPITLLAPKELKAIHPLGKSPVITDGEGADMVTVAESGAIIEYILEKYGGGRLRPQPGTPEGRRFNFYLHYAEGSAMPPLLVSLILSKVTKPPVPIFVRSLAKLIEAGVKAAFTGPQIKTHFDFLESELTKFEWFAGSEFSAADIQMSFPIEAMQVRDSLSSRPHLKRFLERIHARPAYQKALAAGGPFTLAM